MKKSVVRSKFVPRLFVLFVVFFFRIIVEIVVSNLKFPNDLLTFSRYIKNPH